MRSSELLDYVQRQVGQQVMAYKIIAGGSAKSSYALHYYADSATFDVYCNIGGEWEELDRHAFLDLHGDDQSHWHVEQC
jgi:hypothetical protein